MNEIKFAEWIAENHYRLYSKYSEGYCLWSDESEEMKTTEQLLIQFLKEQDNGTKEKTTRIGNDSRSKSSKEIL